MSKKIAVVGLGNIAKKHLSAIKKNKSLKLVALCDKDKKKLNQYKNLKTTKLYNSYDKLISNESIDYVVLCTPSGYHPIQTIKASQKKIHVISEKPMATNMQDAKKILNEIKKNKTNYFVVKQNRFLPYLVLLKKLIDKGVLGAIYFVNINVFWNRPQSYYNLDKWRGTIRLDGGAVLNQASHYVDLLYWLFGKIKKISCFKKTLARKIEVEDTAVISLQWEKGFLGSLNVSMLNYMENYKGSLTLVTENGTITIGGKSLNKLEYCKLKNKSVEKKFLKTKSLDELTHDYCYIEFYKSILKYNKKNSKEIFLSDAVEAQNTMSIIFNSYDSSNLNKIKFIK